jgi:hypothetical protein
MSSEPALDVVKHELEDEAMERDSEATQAAAKDNWQTANNAANEAEPAYADASARTMGRSQY